MGIEQSPKGVLNRGRTIEVDYVRADYTYGMFDFVLYNRREITVCVR